MAIPNTRNTFKEHCLMRLGKPVIDINVDPDQVEDRIDEALQFFNQYHYDGTERVYLKHLITAADVTRGKANDTAVTATDIDGSTTADWVEQKNWIPVPQNISAVVKVFPITDSNFSNIFDTKYQLRLNDLYNFTNTSIVHYQMTMMHLDFLDDILVGETPIRFNQHQNRLYLDADWGSHFTEGEYIIIEAFRNLDESTYVDVWNDIHLKKYCTALIKKQWGANLIKFNGITMLGGVTLNGEQLFNDATDELNKLEEEIQLAYELPPMFALG